jgi:hypothetical protein
MECMPASLHDGIVHDLTPYFISRFRLVSLQIEELQDCHSRDDLEEQLESLPRNLDEVYGRIVSGINKRHREDVLKILQWLAFSARPLLLAEIAQVVGVVPDEDLGLCFKPSRVYPDTRSVLEICSSLVIETEGKYRMKLIAHLSLTYNLGRIKLSHMSVKDYLLSQHHRIRTVGFCITETLSHSFIGQTCLAYLLQFNNPDILTGDLICNHPLAQYAARYWILHFESGGKGSLDGERKLIRMFFQPTPTKAFMAWVKLWDIDTRRSFPFPPTIYYASLTGLLQAVTTLVENGVDVNGKGGFEGTALQVAARGGSETIVSYLLEKGADVNARGGFYSNALQAASFFGHGMVVSQLLEKGADVNATGGYYGNALQAASSIGHEVIVRQLL